MDSSSAALYTEQRSGRKATPFPVVTASAAEPVGGLDLENVRGTIADEELVYCDQLLFRISVSSQSS